MHLTVIKEGGLYIAFKKQAMAKPSPEDTRSLNQIPAKNGYIFMFIPFIAINNSSLGFP